MNQYKNMTDEYLKETYVPDIYQKSIYNIDYSKLKESGIKLISFDIDDTIAPMEKNTPDKAVITLFEKLKNMGFELFLVSNANNDRVQQFGTLLGVKCISRASKPHISSFETIRQIYTENHNSELTPDEMAHVGNSMIKDVATGNIFGVTTCLVRDASILPRTGRILNPVKTEGQKLREVLLKRGIWRKHHLNITDDQYYQLGQFQSKKII